LGRDSELRIRRRMYYTYTRSHALNVREGAHVRTPRVHVRVGAWSAAKSGRGTRCVNYEPGMRAPDHYPAARLLFTRVPSVFLSALPARSCARVYRFTLPEKRSRRSRERILAKLASCRTVAVIPRNPANHPARVKLSIRDRCRVRITNRSTN